MTAKKCSYCTKKFDPSDASIEFVTGTQHRVAGYRTRLNICPECWSAMKDGLTASIMRMIE